MASNYDDEYHDFDDENYDDNSFHENYDESDNEEYNENGDYDSDEDYDSCEEEDQGRFNFDAMEKALSDRKDPSTISNLVQDNLPNIPLRGQSIGSKTKQAPQQRTNPLKSNIKWSSPPSNYLNMNENNVSNCHGRKRALLIGINYIGTDAELRGCINDVHNIRNFLIKNFNWPKEAFRCLTDDSGDSTLQPTKENIINAMRWLVSDSEAGDSLFFHYSGHGATLPNKNPNDIDQSDDTICPVDFRENGMIVDGEMNDIMVGMLPPAVRLTALFDCCHSGSALDLPFMYKADGSMKTDHRALSKIGQQSLALGMDAMRGNYIGAGIAAFGILKTMVKGGPSRAAAEKRKRTKGSSCADVIMFSGCKDDQTSADAANLKGEGGGAMTFAFLDSMNAANCNIGYGPLLVKMREHIFSYGHTQKPQLSSARYMDMQQPFLI